MSIKHLTEWVPSKGIATVEFVLFAIATSPIIHWFEKYIFGDKEFLIAVCTLILMDTLLAVIYHFKAKSISSEGFSKFAIKVVIYGCVLIVIHVGTNLKTEGDTIWVLQYLDSLGYTAIYVRESLSIFEKIEKLRPGTIPAVIMKRFKDFDDDGKLKEGA